MNFTIVQLETIRDCLVMMKSIRDEKLLLQKVEKEIRNRKNPPPRDEEGRIINKAEPLESGRI